MVAIVDLCCLFFLNKRPHSARPTRTLAFIWLSCFLLISEKEKNINKCTNYVLFSASNLPSDNLRIKLLINLNYYWTSRQFFSLGYNSHLKFQKETLGAWLEKCILKINIWEMYKFSLWQWLLIDIVTNLHYFFSIFMLLILIFCSNGC